MHRHHPPPPIFKEERRSSRRLTYLSVTFVAFIHGFASCHLMTPPEGWTRCHHFTQSKNRYCRQVITAGSPYCGNHRHLYAQSNDNNDDIDHPPEESQGNDLVKKSHKTNHPRIPCPVDPTHHIYANKIEQHLAKCPKNVLLQNLKRQRFYHENVNSGGYGECFSKRGRWKTQQVEENSPSSLSKQNDDEPIHSLMTHSRAHTLAIYAIELFQDIFMHHHQQHPAEGESSKDRKESPQIKSIQQLTLEDILHTSKIELKDFNHPNLEAQVQGPIQYHRIKIGGDKHAKQIFSIVGHVQHHWNQSYPSPTTTSCIIVELGAGRAMTGFVTACHIANQMSTDLTCTTTAHKSKVQLVVIDKNGSRAKADTAIRRLESSEMDKKISIEDAPNHHVKAISMNRIKCDLAHAYIPTILQSLMDDDDEKITTTTTTKENEEKKSMDSSNIFNNNKSGRNIIAVAKHLCGAGSDLALKSLIPIRSQLHSCYLATCCHGLCTYEDYVGRDSLRDLFLNKSISSSSSSSIGTRDQGSFLFGEEDFLLLRRWSSSAVSDTSHNQPSKDSIDNRESGNCTTKSNIPKDSYSVTTMSIVHDLGLQCGPQGLGRICQRLIDYGRLQFMKNQLFLSETDGNEVQTNVELCHYVTEDVTPQNALLKGWWD